MGKEKNVFISHYNKDDEHIQKLKDLLEKRGYTLKNASIDSTKPNRVINEEAVKRLLRLRIQWAGTFICLVGVDTHTRPWVDWEIHQAHLKGKRIIGVYIHGSAKCEIPRNLNKYGHGLTGWNSDNIVDALEGKDIGWCNPDGSSREALHSVERVNC